MLLDSCDVTMAAAILIVSDEGSGFVVTLQFPWVLDMEPYTAEGMARRESVEQNKVVNDEPAPTDGDTTLSVCTTASNQINYELVGVVVHSGQANAGHYYSFIKDRRSVIMAQRQVQLHPTYNPKFL